MNALTIRNAPDHVIIVVIDSNKEPVTAFAGPMWDVRKAFFKWLTVDTISNPKSGLSLAKMAAEAHAYLSENYEYTVIYIEAEGLAKE